MTLAPGIYVSRSLASAVIVVAQDGSRLIVPAIPNGWAQRHAYRGHDAALQPLRPVLRQLLALCGNYGIPTHQP